jgi:hypothetical protein
MVEEQTMKKHLAVEMTTVSDVPFKIQKKFMVFCGSVVNQLLRLDRELTSVCSVKHGKLPKNCTYPCYLLHAAESFLRS